MAQRKSLVKRAARSVRQSVTIPATLALEVRREAKERNVTMSRALVTLAERGVEAEAAARARLAAEYEEFMSEADPGGKNEAGKELIQAIFGRDAIVEYPLRVPKPLRDRLGFRPDTELEAVEQQEGVLLKRIDDGPSMVKADGLWVHRGSAEPGANWDSILDDVREERIGSVLKP